MYAVAAGLPIPVAKQAEQAVAPPGPAQGLKRKAREVPGVVVGGEREAKQGRLGRMRQEPLVVEGEGQPTVGACYIAATASRAYRCYPALLL